MNLKEIRDEAYDMADDYTIDDEDHLWTIDEMNRIINRVYKKIASDTHCITDANSSICSIASNVIDYTTYTVGTKDYIWANSDKSWLYHENVAPFLYKYDSKILKIEEVKWTYRQWKLIKVNVRKWQTNPYWEQVKGMPTEYSTDYMNGYIAVNFRSMEDDILQLVVKRLPLFDLKIKTDEPEFASSYHEFFINGILALMYEKQDSQCFDKEKSEYYYSRFLLDLDEIKNQESQLQQTLGSNGTLKAFL